jgi:hypothetical protein
MDTDNDVKEEGFLPEAEWAGRVDPGVGTNVDVDVEVAPG